MYLCVVALANKTEGNYKCYALLTFCNSWWSYLHSHTPETRNCNWNHYCHYQMSNLTQGFCGVRVDILGFLYLPLRLRYTTYDCLWEIDVNTNMNLICDIVAYNHAKKSFWVQQTSLSEWFKYFTLNPSFLSKMQLHKLIAN